MGEQAVSNVFPELATEPQLDFIAGMQKRLHLSKALLNNHVQRQFGYGFDLLTKRDASVLIDEMKGWCDVSNSVPPVIQREAGQTDLPGFES
jgi:hypothetical protein